MAARNTPLPSRSGRLVIYACLTAVATLALALAARALIASSDEPRLPNFVVIMTDDQAIRDMDVMTSTKRLLRDEGVTFENSFVSFPLCCPSRVSFLTGQHPHNHGVLSNQLPDGGFEGFAGSDEATLPVALQEAGYATGLFGKYLNGYGEYSRENPEYAPPGWSRWHAVAHRGYFDYTLAENGELRDYGNRPRDYQTDVLARKAARFMERASSRGVPFFAFVPTFAVHTHQSNWGGETPNPRPAPRHADALRDREFKRPPNFDPEDVSDKPSFITKLGRLKPERRRAIRRHERDRARSLLAVDESVGMIVRRLRESGQLENTHLIFTSDHGFQFGELRRRGKQDLYEGSTRVPLIIRGPRIPKGKTVEPIVSNVDLAPTILALAGVDPLRTQDGINLKDVIDEPGDYSERDVLLANSGGRGVRTPRHLYAEYRSGSGKEYELYDMANDPYQLQNLVDASTGELREPDPDLEEELGSLRSRLAELRACEGTSGSNSCE